MRKVLNWAVFGVLIFALLLWNVVVRELGQEFLFEPSLEERIAKVVDGKRSQLPLDVEGGAVMDITHRGKTLTYMIKLNLDRPRLPLNTPIDRMVYGLRESFIGGPPELKEQVTREICANRRPLLKLGGMLEYHYVDRQFLPVGGFVLTDRDCTSWKSGARGGSRAHIALGQTDQALERYGQLLRHHERLAQAEPDRADYQRDLIVSYVRMSEIEPAAARRHLSSALDIARSLQTRGRLAPTDAWIPDELARRLAGLSDS
jgi:hypothetical protein